MPKCDLCGKEIPMPYTCGYCGGSFCSRHRLPENHSCEGLEDIERRTREEGRIYRGISEDLKRGPREARRGPGEIRFRIGGEPEPEEEQFDEELSDLFRGPFGLMRGFFLHNATMIFIMLMLAVHIGKLVTQLLLGSAYYTPGNFGTLLYFLAPSRVTVVARPWTLLTSIFVHGSFFHLFVNGIVLFFLGPELERRIGRRKFIYLFLGAGVLAAAAQLLATSGFVVVLGASGAILGILGTLTALAPKMPVLLFFFIPMELWVLTLGYGAISAILAFTGIGGSIGHMAHFAGLVVGLLYGYKLRKEGGRRRRGPLELLMGR